MRILCLADTHIAYWLPYAEIGEEGMPDRLSLYLDLAKDIQFTSDSYNCDLIMLAGDVFESSTQKPQSLYVGAEFLRLLSKKAPLLVTHGNHDLDFRGDVITEKHSILKEICEGLKNVIYVPREDIVDVDGTSIHVRPWVSKDNFVLPKSSADVFMGHGLVKDYKLDSGISFDDGFKISEFIKKFKLSIVGDIHQKTFQVDDKTGNKFIIPGCAIQNSWADAPDCGFYIADIDEGNDYYDIPKFIAIHEEFPNKYHRFLYANEAQEQKSTKLNHYKIRSLSKSKAKRSAKGMTDDIKSKLDVNKILHKYVDALSLPDTNIVKECINDMTSNCKDNYTDAGNNYYISSIKIKNFLSIKEYEMDLKDKHKGQGDSVKTLIFGNNGTGKSAIFEAMFWGLSGKSARGLMVDEVARNGTNDTRVDITFSSDIEENPEILCKRSRISGRSKFEVFSNNQEYKASSIRNTEEDLKELVGFSLKEINSMVYFTTSNPLLFGDMTPSTKSDIISRIVGVDYIDELKRYSLNKKDEYQRKVIENETNIRSLQDRIYKDRKLIEEKEAKLKESDDEKAIRIELDKLKEEGETEESLRKLEDKLGFLNKELETKRLKYKELKTNYAHFEREFNKYSNLSNSDEKCPTCNQPLSTEESKNKIREKYRDARDKMEEITKSIDVVKSEGKELSINDIDPLNKNVSRVRNILSKIKELESKISKDNDVNLITHLKETISTNKGEVETIRGDYSYHKKLADSWKSVSSFLVKGGFIYKQLYKHSSSLLQQEIETVVPSDGARELSIKIKDDLTITAKFLGSQNYVSYNMMSSGQRRIVDIVMMVSLNNLFSRFLGLDRGVLGILVFDETLSYLDPRYYDFALSVLDSSLSRNIFIITHNDVVCGNRKIMVKKDEDGCSNYIEYE